MSTEYKTTNTIPLDDFKKGCIELGLELDKEYPCLLIKVKETLTKPLIFRLNKLNEVYGFRHNGDLYKTIKLLEKKFKTRIISEYDEEYHDLFYK